MRSVSALVIVGILCGVTAAPATARQPSEPARPLHWEVDPDGSGPIEAGDVVEGSSARVYRAEDGVSYEIRTSGLVKGHGYTVWFFSYDNPDACITGDGTAGSRCTVADLFFNPAALGSLMWGRSGKFVKTSGIARFKGHRPHNAVPCATEPAVVDEDCSGVLIGRGLLHPMTAEIHFVLRDHGPDQKGVEDETTTINGGCDPETNAGMPVYGPGWGTPGNFACYDPQGN